MNVATVWVPSTNQGFGNDTRDRDAGDAVRARERRAEQQRHLRVGSAEVLLDRIDEERKHLPVEGGEHHNDRHDGQRVAGAAGLIPPGNQ